MLAATKLEEHFRGHEPESLSKHIDLLSYEYQEVIEKYTVFASNIASSFKMRNELEIEQVDTPISGPFLKKETRGETSIASITIPSLEGLGIRNPILTSTIRKLLHTLWAIVVSKAMQVQFPVYKTTVAVFNDPSEDRHQALLRIFTEANAAQVTAFWDSLEGNLQDWISSLSEHQKFVFSNRVSLRIHWR
jgi:hypothetical protein